MAAKDTVRTTPAAPKRARAQHLGPARRRPQILDTALTLFLEGGYEGTSMASVADAAGVSKPVVYDAFGSKNDLFTALLEREEARILGEISAGFANVDLNDPEKTLTEGYTAFLRGVASSPRVYRLIFFQEGGGNAALSRRIQAGRQAQVRALAALSRSWLSQRDPDLRHSELDRLSEFLGESLVGLAEAGARTVLSEESGWEPDEAGRVLGRLAASAAAAI
jgi:AcrR family transcriptional regulator